ncbi:MAG: NAD-dependent epimerase/dehydratase family protein [Candidatus Thorarchaeota archaeon]|jgi:nucleoside-diphosphate-sugar epimerase
MRVLLTGAFGNIGESAMLFLLETDHETRCLDVRTPRSEKVKKRLLRISGFETAWGDIRDADLVQSAMTGVDCVVHLAAIIPPASDNDPELTRAVNVGGTVNILGAAENLGTMPKIIYASSIATYGHCPGRGPPRTADDPQEATDLYTETKIECEQMIRRRHLPWTILRFGVVPPLSLKWFEAAKDPFIFSIPLEQRIEFVHTRDIGLAIANAVSAQTEGKILLLGGGERCRMTYREFISGTLKAVGMKMLPDSAFLQPTCDEEYFHTDWMDTEESQRLLQFQTKTFDEYLKELRDAIGLKRYLVKLIHGMAQNRLLSVSPYYKASSEYTVAES